MPKVVDHDERRREIGTAALQVIAQEGLERLTVRKVAALSGWSTGVLAHYVRDKEEIISLGIDTMAERFIERLEALPWDDPRVALRLALHQMLPLDSDRYVEARAWFRLATYHPGGTGASETIRAGHRELRDVITHTLEAIGIGDDRPSSDVAGELIALADGLAVHHLIDPHGVPRTRIVAMLDARLESL